MSFVYQFLLNSMVIAVLILVRVIANRYTLRRKLSCDHADNDCSKIDCSERSEAERSASHAP